MTPPQDVGDVLLDFRDGTLTLDEALTRLSGPCLACQEKDAARERVVAELDAERQRVTNLIAAKREAEQRATAAEQALGTAKAMEDAVVLHNVQLTEQKRAVEQERDHARKLLKDISVSLSDAGVGPATIHGAVLELIQRAEQAEQARDEALKRLDVWRGRWADVENMDPPLADRVAELNPFSVPPEGAPQ